MNKIRVNDVIDLNNRLLGYVYRTPEGSNKRQIEGVFVGILGGDTIRIGWSKVNRKAGDDFNLALGIKKALGRAYMNDDDYADHIVNLSCGKFRRKFMKFQDRCRNYFQGHDFQHEVIDSKEVDGVITHEILSNLAVIGA